MPARWGRSSRLGHQVAPEARTELMSLEAGPPGQYGGTTFPLVGVPLVMKLPPNSAHPLGLLSKTYRKLRMLDELILETDGGFRRPGQTTPAFPNGRTDARWRIDAERDCVVVDYWRKGKYLKWRYDELRVMKSGAAPGAGFRLGGGLLEDTTFLACIGTAGRLRWQYHLRMRDAKSSNSPVHSVVCTTWSDETDFNIPYNLDDDDDDDGSASSGSASPSSSRPRSPSPLRAPTDASSIDAASAPVSPRHPILREAHRRRCPHLGDGWRCCRRRQPAGADATRGQQMSAEASSAPEAGAVRSKLRNWRLRVGVGADRGGGALPQVGVTPPAPQARSMRSKLLNEDQPTDQKENVYCDP